MAAIIVSSFAFLAHAQDDRALVRTILTKIGRKDATVEDVAEFSQDGRVIVLNLNRRGISGEPISEIPPEVFRLSALRGLLLRDNKLTSLPRDIGDLIQLVELNLANNNDLGELPSSIGNLANLKKLDLRFCGLSTLPYEITGLKSLEMLQLWGNKFTGIPEYISELTALTDLHLNNNQLLWLPTSITKMENLKYIDTQRNQLCNLPPEIESWLSRVERSWKSNQWCGGGNIQEVR